MPFIAAPHSRGFTLIELLVVIFIASLTAGLLVINISFDTIEDQLKEEAQRLHALLNFAHEQSIIRAEEYGVRFHQTGYRFMILEDDLWIDLSTDRHLVSHELKNDMEIELFIEDIDVTLNDADDEAELIRQQEEILKNKKDNSIIDTDKKEEENLIKPQIFLLSSGELSPAFSCRIRIPGQDISAEVQGTINGDYELAKDDEE